MIQGDLERAAEAIRQGGVVAAPTDTLVGLVARALDASAVAKVLAIKGSERSAPLPVLIEDLDMALGLADGLSESALSLAERGWPGPMTLVVRARPKVLPVGVTAGRPTVGLRIPGPSPALELLQMLHEPLTGTSANRTGHQPTSSSAELDPVVVGMVDCVAAGSSVVGVASTVIDVTGEEPKVLRQGSFVL